MIKPKAFQFFLHLITWLLFFSIPFIAFDRFQVSHIGNPPSPSPGIMGITITNIFLIVFFYLNYLLLFPHFFVRKKFIQYLLSLVGFTILFFTLQGYVSSLFSPLPVMPVQNDFHPVAIGPGL